MHRQPDNRSFTQIELVGQEHHMEPSILVLPIQDQAITWAKNESL